MAHHILAPLVVTALEYVEELRNERRYLQMVSKE
jgi:hypothetical protein